MEVEGSALHNTIRQIKKGSLYSLPRFSASDNHGESPSTQPFNFALVNLPLTDQVRFVQHDHSRQHLVACIDRLAETHNL